MVLTDQQALLTCVAVLLTALFVLRRRSRLEAARPPRRTPVTKDELGRAVFEVARSADLDTYRGLFLIGGEVRDVLGQEAVRYLDERTPLLLRESLVSIGARVADVGQYVGCHVEGNRASIEVRLPGDAVRHVPIGTIVRVGDVWRLQDPVRE